MTINILKKANGVKRVFSYRELDRGQLAIAPETADSVASAQAQEV